MKPMKLAYNRVWRTYTGGKAIDMFYRLPEPKDGHFPEVWIASTTAAVNPEPVENEGLSRTEDGGNFLKDLIERDPAGYLGKKHTETFGCESGVLVKLLDAAERLTIQVHPDNKMSERLFNSDFGKTEAWYILEGREIKGQPPHIYLGFKKGIKPAYWIDLFLRQDIEGMLACMHKIYVKPGDVFLIEGGTPHAIGAGCCIVEIQEPTDLTIRIERTTPGGYQIPDRICHQGLGFEKMFECFHYDGLSEAEIRQRWQLVDGPGGKEELETLISYEDTNCFSLKHIRTERGMSVPDLTSFGIMVVLNGEGDLTCDDGRVPVSKGDKIFIPNGVSGMSLTAHENSEGIEALICMPPKA